MCRQMENSDEQRKNRSLTDIMSATILIYVNEKKRYQHSI